MHHRLQRWYGQQDAHFITGSCYRRQTLFDPSWRKDLFLSLLEGIRMHSKPVRRGLVTQPGDWPSSSDRFWTYAEPGIVRVNYDSLDEGRRPMASKHQE